MMKLLTYSCFIIIIGCDILVEQSTPLEGDYYIRDGWLAFSSEEYGEADRHFNTAIETNDTGSVYHFLAYIGKGWTYMYNAKTKYDSILVKENMIELSGEYFDIALSILPELDENLYKIKDIMNLYSGLTIQRAYIAKQQAANETLWETSNSELSSEIDALYRQSIVYSYEVDSEYIFQYDTDLEYEDIILLRIENYILIGEIDSAIYSYNDYGFKCNGNDINEQSIIKCLCITINDGSCPFDQE